MRPKRVSRSSIGLTPVLSYKGTMWKWLLALLLFFFVVIELVFFAPTQGDREQEKDWISEAEGEPELKQDIEQVLSGSDLVGTEGEKKVWELTASQARKKKGKDNWVLDKVNVKFFGENSAFYTAVGKNGFVDENQSKLKIQGDVVITSSNGYVMNTEVIFYKTNGRTIDGPEHVKVIGPKEAKGDGGPLYMESDTFDANLNSNIINLKKNVRGRKKMSGGRNMKISSREAMFSGQSNIAVFRKDVVIDVDSMTITGPRAKFVYKEGELHSCFIDGGVKIKDIGKWGVAGEAEVFFKEDKYVFKNSPKVVQGDDQLIGDEIVIYDGGERVQVKKAKTRYNTNKPAEEGGV